MWVSTHFCNNTLAIAFNIRMSDTDNPFPITDAVCNVIRQSRKLLQSYKELVNFLLVQFTADQAIAEFDVTIIRYIQLVNMEPDLVANSCNEGDDCYELTMKNVVINEVNPSVRRSLRYCWAQSTQSNITEVSFQAESLLSIQKCANVTIVTD